MLLLIGFVGLFQVAWPAGAARCAIGIGEAEYRGRGYGTEALRLLLRYAFAELGLHRVGLTVFEYNRRAISSYEKAGFQIEGREREAMLRDGRRWDIVHMGVLACHFRNA